MRQDRIKAMVCAAIAVVLVATLVGGGHAAAGASVKRPSIADAARGDKPADDAVRARRAANALRQFTGYVSAVDKTSLTVEKRGKAPESRVFVKHDDMRTTGDIEKDARVTVYYREEGGKAIAHRVVAKPARSGSNRKG